MTFVIDSTSVKSSAAAINASSRYQHYLEIAAHQFPISDANIALNQGSEPSHVYLLVDKVFVKIDIPKVLLIASNHPQFLIVILILQ